MITNSIGMEFVQIPAGEFDMGSPSDEEGRDSDEGPVHSVRIDKAFYMGKYEVTQKQWRDIMGDNPSYFKGDDLPIEQVSWDDVQEFIKKLNEKEGIDTYHLPSEAEWEYADRAGTTKKYCFGDDESRLGDYAWYDDNSGDKTHPVGKKKPNNWGLYDMHGNVWEWVQDQYHDNYEGAPANGSAWENGDGPRRVFRGSGWFSDAQFCRSAARRHHATGYRNNNLGVCLLKLIIMPEAYCSRTVCRCVDNDQTVYPVPVFAGQRDMRPQPLVGFMNLDGGSGVNAYIWYRSILFLELSLNK